MTAALLPGKPTPSTFWSLGCKLLPLTTANWYVYSPVIMCLHFGAMVLNYLKACAVVLCSIYKEIINMVVKHFIFCSLTQLAS